jgi:hypothetical protein
MAGGVPSDSYGWRLSRIKGIQMDPTDILRSGVVNPQTLSTFNVEPNYIHEDGYQGYGSVSPFWGIHSGLLAQGFSINFLRSSQLGHSSAEKQQIREEEEPGSVSRVIAS